MTMSVLLLRLASLMQSWGTQSRFTHRDTAREPSKSGVVGLLCAAMGIPRDDTARIGELAALPMAVRVDKEGTLQRDFQTAGGGSWPGRRYGVWLAKGGVDGRTVTSERYYLADADFIVGIQGDGDLLRKVHGALERPVWPLFLGRMAFPPAFPVWLADGLKEGDLISVLSSYPWVRPEAGVQRLRLVVECEPGEGQPRLDVPQSFQPARRSYVMRYVRNEWIPVDRLPRLLEGEACTFRD